MLLSLTLSKTFEFGDINDNHVGIDINNMESNASATAGWYYNNTDEESSSTKQDLNLKSGKPILAWVDYDSAQSVISVTLSASSSKPKKPILSYAVDLSPILQEYMYVGFSASTGLLASSHYILGWSFKINGNAPPLDLSSLPQLPSPKKKNTSLIIGVLVTVVVVVVAALFAILLCFYLYRRYKNDDVVEAWELEIGPHRYSYKELKKATKGNEDKDELSYKKLTLGIVIQTEYKITLSQFCNLSESYYNKSSSSLSSFKGFKEKELLGQGGFGRVYKGKLPNSKAEVSCQESFT